jgi:transposase
MYAEGGIESLSVLNYRSPESAFEPYKEQIAIDFQKVPSKSLKETISRLEVLTGVSRKIRQVANFMKKIGFKRLKVGHIPAKGDPHQQQEFLEEKLQPKLKEAKEGKRAVLFLDSAHFVHSVFLGFLWVLQRVFIKSSSGRSRFNVLGAIDAMTHHLFTVCNTSYVNAETVCEILKELASYYKIPITLILDNARYQKCQLVSKLASDLQIELLYLPPYSPNLNLIERLWGYVKRESLYCQYYETFADFKSAIESCLEKINGANKDRVRSLLAWKFQVFKKEVKLVA